MAGFVGAFKPTANPFGGQVARNTTGFNQSIAPPPATPFANQVLKNTTGFAPGSSPVYPNSSLPGNSAQVTRNTTGFQPGGGGSGAPPLTAAQQRLAELQADPGYASAQVDATRAAQDAQSARQASIRGALIDYGGDLPTGFQDKYGDVDAATLATAKANPFSQAAQNLRQFGQTQEQNRQAEAANGSIFSGQAPTDIGNENYGQGLNLYNLANSFASTANDAIGKYAGVLDTNRGNMTDALFKAEQNQQTNPAYASTASGNQSAPQPTPHVGPTPVTKPTTITPKFAPTANPFSYRNAKNAI